MSAVPIAEAASKPAGLRVLNGRRLPRPKVGMWIIYTAFAVLAFFALIYSRTALDGSAFELDQIERQISEQEDRYQQLRLEVARLASPERIIPAAEEMGLVFPAEVTTVTATGVIVAQEGSIDERWAEVKSILSASP